jgi:hypothetical protein
MDVATGMANGPAGYATHEVYNQAGPLPDFNAYAQDAALRDAMAAFGAGWAEARLTATGELIGSARMRDLPGQQIGRSLSCARMTRLATGLTWWNSARPGMS